MIDRIDRQILDLLQQNARLTIQEIGQQINLSKTPVHERIRRLERDGVIDRYVTILNRKKIDSSLLAYCQVTLDKQTRDSFETYEAAVRVLPNVLECNRVSGTFDYLIKLVARNMDDYNDSIRSNYRLSRAHYTSAAFSSSPKSKTRLSYRSMCKPDLPV